MVKKREYGNSTIYLINAIVFFMSFIAFMINGLLVFLFPPIILALLSSFISKNNWFHALYIYLSLALVTFYSSICNYNLTFLVPYVFILLRYGKLAEVFEIKHISPIGVLGPSLVILLRPLIVFLIAALINYRIIFSISIILLLFLSYTLYKYLFLLKVETPIVNYPRKISMGEKLWIRTKIKSNKSIWVQLIYMKKTKLFKISGEQTIKISVPAQVYGRHQFLLRIYIYDDGFFARRLLLEKPIVFQVVPSFMSLLEYAKAKIFSRTDVRRMLEPVETRIFFIEPSKYGPLKSLDYKEIESALINLPYFIRVMVRNLIRSGGAGKGLPGGKDSIETKSSKNIFGEYSGVRYYVPGDKLKNIHWKKTVSRQILIVKEYTSGGEGEASSFIKRHGPVIILDLSVSSIRELDSVLRRFVELLVVSSFHGLHCSVLVLFIIGDNIVITLHGKLIDVLNLIVMELDKIIPKIIYEYKSFSVVLEEQVIKEIIDSMDRCFLIKFIVEPNIAYAKKFIEVLVENNVLPPRNIIVIHGSPSSMKYSFLKHYLVRNGFRVVIVYNNVKSVVGEF